MTSIFVEWPAIVLHADDAELYYLCDAHAWNGYAHTYGNDVEEDDRLIDVTGAVFSLQQSDDGGLSLTATETYYDLNTILGLVKAHAAHAGSCCVAKLYAPSIAEAFKIVKATGEED